eukprot:gene16936-biopygen9823
MMFLYTSPVRGPGQYPAREGRHPPLWGHHRVLAPVARPCGVILGCSPLWGHPQVLARGGSSSGARPCGVILGCSPLWGHPKGAWGVW